MILLAELDIDEVGAVDLRDSILDTQSTIAIDPASRFDHLDHQSDLPVIQNIDNRMMDGWMDGWIRDLRFIPMSLDGWMDGCAGG